MKRVAIVDSGAGNLTSIFNALKAIGAEPYFWSSAAQAIDCEHLVLPGVGSFPDGMDRLTSSGLASAVVAHARAGKPILGICLGMQLLADHGDEFKPTQGLGLIPGRVTKLKVESSLFRLPHIGWNDVTFRSGTLTKGLGASADFYFVHSYVYEDPTAPYVVGCCEYGAEVVSIIESGNVFGTQFHPEKSQAAGLTILRNFLSVC
ncbi:MAG: imidazole glycerol phosphate synthase subunit HisH [Proteobacteria bacterium]|nr:imidazole glycerol phosphate synthase subunit HisH [Pseudomonadota bacterium]